MYYNSSWFLVRRDLISINFICETKNQELKTKNYELNKGGI